MVGVVSWQHPTEMVLDSFCWGSRSCPASSVCRACDVVHVVSRYEAPWYLPNPWFCSAEAELSSAARSQEWQRCRPADYTGLHPALQGILHTRAREGCPSTVPPLLLLEHPAQETRTLPGTWPLTCAGWEEGPETGVTLVLCWLGTRSPRSHSGLVVVK